MLFILFCDRLSSPVKSASQNQIPERRDSSLRCAASQAKAVRFFRVGVVFVSISVRCDQQLQHDAHCVRMTMTMKASDRVELQQV